MHARERILTGKSFKDGVEIGLKWVVTARKRFLTGWLKPVLRTVLLQSENCVSKRTRVVREGDLWSISSTFYERICANILVPKKFKPKM